MPVDKTLKSPYAKIKTKNISKKTISNGSGKKIIKKKKKCSYCN